MEETYADGSRGWRRSLHSALVVFVTLLAPIALLLVVGLVLALVAPSAGADGGCGGG